MGSLIEEAGNINALAGCGTRQNGLDMQTMHVHMYTLYY